MKKMSVMFVVVLVAAVALALPVPAFSQGSTEISVVALDGETFVTVQETGSGDMLSLYRVRGEKIYLVDTVFNSTSRDPKLPKRYLHHLEVENR